MDYIIFGLGVGATLTLAGWSLREWGAAIRDRAPAPEAVLSGSELVDRMAWRRFCRSCGTVLAIVGALVLATTLAATLLMASNRTGTIVVLSACSTGAIATLVWLGLFLHRFGSRGILRPKPVPAKTAQPAAKAAATAPRTSPGVFGPPAPLQATSTAPSVATPATGEANVEVPEDTIDRAPDAEAPSIAAEAEETVAETRNVTTAFGPPAPKAEAVAAPPQADTTAATEPEADAASSPSVAATSGDASSAEDTDDAAAPGPTTSGIPGSDERSDPEVDAEATPPGREDAVRNLRERRMKRRIRGSREPD